MSIPTPPPAAPHSLLDVGTIARRLGCSTRHVQRLAAAGEMPPPLKLGALNRWSSVTIDAWIASGCKSASEAADAKRGVGQ